MRILAIRHQHPQLVPAAIIHQHLRHAQKAAHVYTSLDNQPALVKMPLAAHPTLTLAILPPLLPPAHAVPTLRLLSLAKKEVGVRVFKGSRPALVKMLQGVLRMLILAMLAHVNVASMLPHSMHVKLEAHALI